MEVDISTGKIRIRKDSSSHFVTINPEDITEIGSYFGTPPTSDASAVVQGGPNDGNAPASNKKYPYTNMTHVIIRTPDQDITLELQDITNQATWSTGTESGLNVALADLEAIIP